MSSCSSAVAFFVMFAIGAASCSTVDPETIYNLGVAFYHGKYGKQHDPAKGCDLLEDAARLGYAPAKTALANCFRIGNGRPEDEARAIEWYREAIADGDREAMHTLGTMYLIDTEDPVYWPEGVRLLEMALDGDGDGATSFILGVAYFKGRGVEQDYQKAFNLFSRAATRGHLLAIALFYEIFSKGLYLHSADEKMAAEYENLFKHISKRLDSVSLEEAVNLLYENGWGLTAMVDSGE